MKDGIFNVTLNDGSVKEYKIVAVVDDEEKYLFAIETNLLIDNNFLNKPGFSVFSLVEDGDDYIISKVKNKERALEIEREILKASIKEIFNN